MFTAEELSVGAKRCVLEYIAPHVPIARIWEPEEAREAIAKEYWRKYSLIVRGDSACQWAGYGDVFASYRTTGEIIRCGSSWPIDTRDIELDQIVNVVTWNVDALEHTAPWFVESMRLAIQSRQRDAKEYSDFFGLPMPDPPRALIQDAHGSSTIIFQHPHLPDLVILAHGDTTVFYSREDDAFTYFHNYDENMLEPSPDSERYLRQGIAHMDTCLSLPKFSDEWVFDGEFGAHRETGEAVMYQLRLMRKKQEADYCLLPDSQYLLSFGITAPEGEDISYSDWLGPGHEHDSTDWSGRIVGLSSGAGFRAPHRHLRSIRAGMFDELKLGDHGIREAAARLPLAFLGWKGCFHPTGEPNVFMYGQSDIDPQKMLREHVRFRAYCDGRKSLLEPNA